MSPPAQTPIAIVGVGCRLPGGANNLDNLWSLLSEGRSGHVKIPKDRWNADEWYDAYPEARQSLRARHGYFIQDDISHFDAKFFGIPSTEASTMDPQQRLFLMTTYEALEDAAIPLETLRGSNTGVFAAIFERSYDRMGFKDLATISRTHMNGVGEAILANRISYVFDLQGPSMTIDTGCSGSLVALHQACQSLKLGESDLALVGGSQLLITPDLLSIMSTVGMLNPDGKSYAFDSRGEGYGRAEGVATLVLKRLDRALQDGDQVHAIIANSGVNQDGKTVGINTPNGDAQADLTWRVYREAGINPLDTSFIEAHGTGTQVGDKEEMGCISRVFTDPSRPDDVYVGSVKTNLGHLEATSGLAGLLKALLVLKHGQIPPNLNFDKPKSSLNLYEKKVKIPLQLTPLPKPRNGGPTRVSLNSFGYGGTNCHVILEDPYPEKKKDSPNGANGTTTNGHNGIINGHNEVTNGHNGIANSGNDVKANGRNGVAANGKKDPEPFSPELILLSASTEKALSSRAQDIVDWIKSQDNITPGTLKSLSYTLGAHRSALSYRRAIVASTAGDLVTELEQKGSLKKTISLGALTFVFSGQGAQWHAMGQELIGSSSVFRSSMAAMDDVLRSEGCQWSLVEELSKSAKESRVGEAEIAQPCTTAVQVALVDLLDSFSIRPARVVGHSSGEIGAAYAAGALTRENAILAAYHRGLSSRKAKKLADIPGAMMAVSLSETEARERVKNLTSGKAVVACVNSPSSQTISGDEEAIDELKTLLDKEGVFARKLKVDTAYHSHHMQRVAEDYKRAISSIESRPVKDGVTFYSSVTGTVKTAGFDAEYWTQNLISQVKFSQALSLLREEQSSDDYNVDATVFIEIGPHSALAGPARQTLTEKPKVEYLSPLVRNSNALQSVLSFVGKLFELGLDVDMKAALTLEGEAKPSLIRDLKPYPWDLAPYWQESRLSKAYRFRPFQYHDLLGLFDPTSTVHEPRWRYFVNLDDLPWISDHVIEGFVIYPGAGYLTMAIEGITQLMQLRGSQNPISKYIIRDVSVSKALVLSGPDGSSTGDIEVQLTMFDINKDESSPWKSFSIRSYQPDGSLSEHCTGDIMVEQEKDIAERDQAVGTEEDDLRREEAVQFLETARQHADTDMTSSEFYDFVGASGNQFGGTFTLLDSVKYDKGHGIYEMSIPDVASMMPYRSFRPHVIHPTTLDASLQINVLLFKKSIFNATCVPTSIPLLEVSAGISTKPGDSLVGVIELEPDGTQGSTGGGWVFQKGADGQLKPVIRLLLDMKAISEAKEDENRPFSQDMVHRLGWNLDTDYLTAASFNDVLSSTLNIDENTRYSYSGDRVSIEEEVQEQLEVDQAASILIRDAVRHIEEHEVKVPPQLLEFLGWMKNWWLASDYYSEIMADLDAEKEDRILKKVEATTGAGPKVSYRVGKALPQMMSGAIQPLEVLFQDDLLAKNYEGRKYTGEYAAAVAYLKLITFKNPGLRFLEIGAGTGGFTKSVFRGLNRQNGAIGLPLREYTYTDVSNQFFEEARENFAQWEDVVTFKTLDADADPLEQGYEAESYDVILAANCLHATTDIDRTISRVRKLLKPGGSLILVENKPSPGPAVGLLAGSLTGWWAHKDFRVDTPLLTYDQWDRVLSDNGFGGIDLGWGDLMIAKAQARDESNESVEGDKTPSRQSAVVISDALDTDQANRIVNELASHAVDITVARWDNATVEEDSVCIIIDHAEKPLLLNPSPELFTSINSLLTPRAKIIWTVVQDTQDPASAAYQGLTNGLLRTLRRESGNSTNIISLDLRHPAPSDEEIAGVIAEVAHRRFWPSTGVQPSAETEIAYQNGRVLIPRISVDDEFLNWARRTMSHGGVGTEAETIPYHGDRSLKAEAATPGLPTSLRFVDAAVDEESPPSGSETSYIVVKTEAHGVNSQSVGIALRQINPATTLSGEFAGTVMAVGQGAQSLHQVGDRVMGFGPLPYANSARTHGLHAYRIPSWMSTEVAASIPLVYSAAYYAIMHIAQLQEGQSVLVNTASGDIDQAAIQLAQHVGATVFCTADSVEQFQLLKDEYGIPESHIFSHQSSGSLERGILRHTNGEGVDLVLSSSSSGEAIRESLDCVKSMGTFINLLGSRGAQQQAKSSSRLSVAALSKSITFVTFDLATLASSQPRLVHRVLGSIVELFEAKSLRPVKPIITYTIDKIEEAFRFVSSGTYLGKIVLTVEPTSLVKGVPAKPLPLQLRKDGTYVIAGGLGHLPARLCVLLASKGAGHIVSLCRREIDEETRQKYMSAVEQHGVKLHIVQCDITDDESMSKAAAYCASSLPPVRGVVNGAMVLRDRTFSQMTIEEWNVSLQAKVYGTLKLDKFFASPDLSFFMTLSSLTAIIGRTGQANYVAGNSFQDAFTAAHANHPHTHYISVNIGIVEVDVHENTTVEGNSSEGAAGKVSLVSSLKQNSGIELSFDEFYANIEYAMTEQARSSELHQTIQGITHQAMVDVNDVHLLENPIFSQLDRARGDKASSGAQGGGGIALDKALAAVKTVEEAEKLVLDAALAKFAVFLDQAPEDIRVDQSLSTIGLDSLVSIELKNWMVRTFQVSLQASELSGAGSILALTATVVARSKLVPDAVRQQQGVEFLATKAEEEPIVRKETMKDVTEPAEGLNGSKATENLNSSQVVEKPNGNKVADVKPTAVEATEEEKATEAEKSSHGFECCKTHKELPRHPLIDLDVAVSDLLHSIGHFAHTREEYEELSRKAHAVAASGSLGRRLYDQLRAEADDPNVESWIAERLSKALYLKRRYPLAPFANFWGSHFDSPAPHSQAERAAVVTTAMWEFKSDVDAGRLEPNYLGGRVNCASTLQWLFNATREPQLGCDRMVKYAGENHIAVLRKGHLFKVELLEEGRILSHKKLKATFQAILDLGIEDPIWAGALTTDDRDSWATIRDNLLALDKKNAAYLNVIESSVFVMCLEDNSPVTREERVSQGYIQNPFNRWQDKSMQVVVTENGQSGTIFDHSKIDAVTVSQLAPRLYSAIENHKPTNGGSLGENGVAVNPASLIEIPLIAPSDIEDRMKFLRGQFSTATELRRYVPHQVTAFGKSYLLTNAAPLKATVDLTIQLASRIYFGYLPASWETVSMAHFHLGRPEIIQVVLRSVVDFCDAALDRSVPHSEVRRKLLQAARDCNAQIVKASEGRNFFRLMDVIEIMSQAQQEEPVPELFSDAIWKRGYPRYIMQTMRERDSTEDPAYMMFDPESVWTNYQLNDESIEVCFINPRAESERFAAALDRAAEIVKAIVQAK